MGFSSISLEIENRANTADLTDKVFVARLFYAFTGS